MAQEASAIQRRLRRPRHAALQAGIVIAVLLSSLTVYSLHAPLAKGVISSGQVVVLSNRKVVQHQEGGTVIEIHVVEGQQVMRGEPLVQLDHLEPTKRLEQLHKDRDGYFARMMVLQAKREMSRELDRNADLQDRSQLQRIAHLLDDHEKAFFADWAKLDGDQAVHKQNIQTYRRRLPGLTTQRDILAQEVRLVEDEYLKQAELVDEQLVSEAAFQALSREKLALQRQLAQIDSEIIDTEESVLREQRLVEQLLLDWQRNASNEMAQARTELDKIEDEITIQHDILARTTVHAPQEGRIFNLQLHTVGAVIGQGEPLMEIVPNDDLVVEARVLLSDIDNVQMGQEAELRFVAFRQGSTPELLAKVVEISADAVIAGDGGASFYLARVMPLANEIDRLGGLEVVPGMPVEVLFKGDDRTVFDYFSGVFSDLWWQALNEE